jgi:hypothetical protein
VLCNRKLGLRLGSAWWEEDAELLVLLFRKKRTSIYARSSLFATLPPGACPAEPSATLCIAEPAMSRRVATETRPIRNRVLGSEMLRAADRYAYRLWKHCVFCRDCLGGKGHLYTPGVRPALLATPCLASLATPGRFTGDHPVDHAQLARADTGTRPIRNRRWQLRCCLPWYVQKSVEDLAELTKAQQRIWTVKEKFSNRCALSQRREGANEDSPC